MSFSYPPLVTTEVELMPCSSIMFFSVVEGFLGLLFFFMTRYWLQYFGFDEQTYAANAGLFKIVAFHLLYSSQLYNK